MTFVISHLTFNFCNLSSIDLNLPLPSTPTLVLPSTFIVDGLPTIIDDYEVFKLEVNSAAIWLMYYKFHWFKLRLFDGIGGINNIDIPLIQIFNKGPGIT